MSWKTENVNVSFEMINQAVDEFSGFILGLPEGDVISQILGMTPNPSKDVEEQRAVRKTLSSITDRTNGGLSLSEIGTNIVSLENAPRDEIFTMIHGQGNPFKPSSLELGFLRNQDYAEFDKEQMRHVLKYREIDNVSFNPVPLTTGSDGTDIRAVVTTVGSSFIYPPINLNRNLS